MYDTNMVELWTDNIRELIRFRTQVDKIHLLNTLVDYKRSEQEDLDMRKRQKIVKNEIIDGGRIQRGIANQRM